MSPCESCFDSRNSFKRFPITMMASWEQCYLGTWFEQIEEPSETLFTLKRRTQGREDSGWRDIPMEAIAAAILVQSILQSCPAVRDGLSGQAQQSPQAGARFFKTQFIVGARMLLKRKEKI